MLAFRRRASLGSVDDPPIAVWIYERLVGRDSEQVVFEDGFGNTIELQQAPD